MAYPYHGNLDDVRRRALDGHVPCYAFAEGAHVEIAALELREVSSAPEHVLNVPGLPGAFRHILHVGVDAGVVAQVLFYIGVRLFDADPDVLGQGVGPDAVDDAEVYGLGPAAELGGDELLGHVEDPGGS